MKPMAERILELVTARRGSVTFAEMIHDIPGFRGDKELVLVGDDYSNIVMWSGLSDEAVDALEELRALGKIHATPTPVLTYVVDGTLLNLPLAKKRRHYKEPHWRPVVFNLGPDSKSKVRE